MDSTVDTQGRCTGECCTDITLRINGGPAMTWGEVAERQAVGAQQMVEENHLERFLVPIATKDHFACSMYDATTRKCTIYANRPATCHTYPKNTIQNGVPSNTCRYCGFSAS